MDKREELIRIATSLFSERGFENTPLSVVCEKANVSKGLISHHFKSKNGLLREIFIKTTELIIEMNQLDQSTKTAHEQLKALLESFFAQLESDKMLFQFNLNMMVQPNTRAILSDLIKERSDFILRSVQSIYNQIDPNTSLIISHAFIAELDGIALNYLGIYDDFPLKEIKAHIIAKYTSQ
ncbi:TetR/AcrR family transcriptional regulator [Roseivirga echinicomitans]|uniref:TetR family transcriptional regulator n=1 Tax=Roseivirga echinicomitans TaxID=296218 RepID=A0A150X2Q9_9BACT|nr:TetR/AcrR family transcriptional regulator [Roseivirga echinicomitans]KYG72994.1 TetR family transcriptional regulator [Roseivirga echinicomitans]